MMLEGKISKILCLIGDVGNGSSSMAGNSNYYSVHSFEMYQLWISRSHWQRPPFISDRILPRKAGLKKEMYNTGKIGPDI